AEPGSPAFNPWHQKLFETLARQASVAMENLKKRIALTELNRVLQQIADITDEKQLLKVVLRTALDLTGCSHGWISRLRANSLEIAEASGSPESRKALRVGQGITGRALKLRVPQIADDVTEPPWNEIYHPFWPDTRAE